jgi:hypothetical protein
MHTSAFSAIEKTRQAACNLPHKTTQVHKTGTSTYGENSDTSTATSLSFGIALDNALKAGAALALK